MDTRIEAGNDKPLLYCSRLRSSSEERDLSLSFIATPEELEGYNFSFSGNRLILGALTPRGICYEALIPSLSRAFGPFGVQGFTPDRSYAGNSRRGAVLKFPDGRSGAFFIGAPSETDDSPVFKTGFWITGTRDSVRPAVAVVLSRPECEGEAERAEGEWISNASYVSGYTGSGTAAVLIIRDLLSLRLLGGISYGFLDPPGVMGRLEADYEHSIFTIKGQAGGASRMYRMPSGDGIGECFAWRFLADLHPVKGRGLLLSVEEVQEHLGVKYNSYRPFSSEVQATLYRQGKIVGLDIAAELAHRGDDEGLIGRRREIEFRCRLEGRGWKGTLDAGWKYTDGAEGEGGEVAAGFSCSRECGSFTLGMRGEYGSAGGGEQFGGEAAISLKQEEVLFSFKSGVLWETGLEGGEVTAREKSGMAWSVALGLQLTQMIE